MKDYEFPVTCDVCGGEGVGSIQTAAAAWQTRYRIVHNDPDVCRYNLERMREKLEKQKETS
jgi:hypothetical protein